MTSHEEAQRVLKDLADIKGRLLVLADQLNDPAQRLMNFPAEAREDAVARWERLKVEAEHEFAAAEHLARQIGIPEVELQKVRDTTARWK